MIYSAFKCWDSSTDSSINIYNWPLRSDNCRDRRSAPLLSREGGPSPSTPVISWEKLWRRNNNNIERVLSTLVFSVQWGVWRVWGVTSPGSTCGQSDGEIERHHAPLSAPAFYTISVWPGEFLVRLRYEEIPVTCCVNFLLIFIKYLARK